MAKYHILSLILSAAAIIACLSSAKVPNTRKVTAEYTYVVPSQQSLEEAKLTAVERAKLQALADEFGTEMSQQNTMTITNTNTDTHTDFMSQSQSQVRGEWIETIGKPEYTLLNDGETLVVKVKVRGVVREVATAKIRFDARPLCNGTTLQHARSDFHAGDEMYAYFNSPVDGWLVIYLLDYSSATAYCILPYRDSQATSWEISKDTPYVFFSKQQCDPTAANEVDEYTLTATTPRERNDLVYIFSTTQFQKSILTRSDKLMPSGISMDDFNRWLSLLQLDNHDVTIERQPLTIVQHDSN